ncbi:T9SS type A sorting domain-containing protein [Candidatus Kapabacteria bacterium]|nr:T9SS type A sorting domain-containing protein [Candidatus Kapabacteria bacterium]
MKNLSNLLIILVLFSLKSVSKEVYYQIQESEAIEVNKIYNNCGGENWFNNRNWPVTLDKFQVDSIPFGLSLNLSDVIISENDNEIVYDASVNTINLAGNNLMNELPDLTLQNLKGLFLAQNSLSGEIPNLVLPRIMYCYLEINNFEGTIPNFNFPNLLWLNLSENNLSGEIPDFDLPMLHELNLSMNNLSGTLPNFNLPEIRILRLNDNSLSGTIPNFNIPYLSQIWFQNNMFDGTIPNFNNAALFYAEFSNNKLADSELDIDDNVLGDLYISGNKFTPDIYDRYDREVFLLLFDNQDTTLPINNNGNTLEIALDNSENLKFKWFVDDFLISDSFENILELKLNGTYRCEISIDTLSYYSDTLIIQDDNLNEYDVIYDDNELAQANLIYESSDGSNWNNKTNWPITSGTKPYGVTFDFNSSNIVYEDDDIVIFDSKIVEIDLSFNNLIGTLPSIELVNLTKLKLNGNELAGRIPSFNFDNLIYLDLSKNLFEEFETSYSLPSLEFLKIAENLIGGELPSFDCPNLRELNLGSNQLTGNIPNFNMPQLQSLLLQNNRLSGTVPYFYMPKLEYLSLEFNELDGELPAFDLPELRILNLYNNFLSGNLPNMNLPEMRVFGLWSNNFTGELPNFNFPKVIAFGIFDNGFSGSFPSINTPRIFQLLAFGCDFSGELPDLSYMKNIQDFVLSENNFSGRIPKLDMPTAGIFLQENNFTGEIPEMNISKMGTLFLRNNNLTGTIPDLKVSTLNLRDNQLTNSNLNVENYYMENYIRANKLTIGNLEKLVANTFNDFNYTPQDTILPIIKTGNILEAITDGKHNRYQWYNQDTTNMIEGATNKTFEYSEDGLYWCVVTNDLLPGLTYETERVDTSINSVITENTHIKFSQSREYITITNQNNSSSSLKIYSLSGVCVNETNNFSGSKQINTRSFPIGLYFVQVTNNGQLFNKKFIVE